MNKVKFSSYFIFISILTLITILVILVQNSYTNLVTTPKSNVESNTLLSAINPNLDLDVLTEIESRQESSNSGVSLESDLVVLTTPTPVSSPSAITISPSPN